MHIDRMGGGDRITVLLSVTAVFMCLWFTQDNIFTAPAIMLSMVVTSAKGQTHVRQIWGLCVVFVAVLLTVAQKCHSACCSCPGEARVEFTEI